MFITEAKPAPITDKKIRMHFFIDPTLPEQDMRAFDDLFIKKMSKPDLFATVTGNQRNRVRSTFIEASGPRIYCCEKLYCTWTNTFHLRYKQILRQLGMPTNSQHIHPEKLFLVARLMQSEGCRPISLIDAMDGNRDIVF